MEPNAENVVQNIGAIAETTSIFYNTIVKMVPKDVALILTQHFMDITIARRTAVPSPEARAAALAAAEAQRRAIAEQRRKQQEKNPPQEKPGDPPAAPPETPPETPPRES